jgi:hypothetical protein
MKSKQGDMAELADAADLKSVGWKTVRVQVPLSPTKLINFYDNSVSLITFLVLVELTYKSFFTVFANKKYRHLNQFH